MHDEGRSGPERRLASERRLTYQDDTAGSNTEQSNDVVEIVKLSVPPSWDGPPLQHHDFDDALYVLEGELTFQLEEQLRGAGPGDLIFAPRGAIYAERVARIDAL